MLIKSNHQKLFMKNFMVLNKRQCLIHRDLFNITCFIHIILEYMIDKIFQFLLIFNKYCFKYDK